MVQLLTLFKSENQDYTSDRKLFLDKCHVEPFLCERIAQYCRRRSVATLHWHSAGFLVTRGVCSMHFKVFLGV